METRCTRFMPRLGHAAHGWFQSIQDTSRRDPSGRASLGSIEGGGKITRGRPRLNQWLFFFGTFNKRWDRWHRINPPIGSFFSAYILSFWGDICCRSHLLWVPQKQPWIKWSFPGSSGRDPKVVSMGRWVFPSTKKP